MMSPTPVMRVIQEAVVKYDKNLVFQSDCLALLSGLPFTCDLAQIIPALCSESVLIVKMGQKAQGSYT